MLTPGIAILLIAFSSVMSFLFALAESTLFSLGKLEIEHLSVRFPSQAAWISRMLKKPYELLATIVFGNMFFNSAIWATGLWLVLKGIWEPVTTLPILAVLILVGCEVVPKALAVRLPQKWAMRVVRPLAMLQPMTYPLHLLANKLNASVVKKFTPESLRGNAVTTDSDYQELLEMGFQQGTLDEDEKEIILEIIALDQKSATDVMTPRSQLVCLPFDTPVDAMAAAARKHRHRRLPLYSETPDQIVGLLDTRFLLLNPEGDFFEFTELPSLVPESMNLLELFKSLQRQRRGMAVVVDEFGGTAGVVTMEDILEEILGPIRNEDEPEVFEIETLDPGKWRVNGLMEIEDFLEYYPALGEVVEVDTMGGLFTMHLGYVPDGEETIVVAGLKLTSKVVGDRRVKELLVHRVPPFQAPTKEEEAT
ncbi:MAG: hemolysin family protein [Verrucomicrobiota bacterium]|nr:hemolysin family protein [Verrucomicrobiota bacterium]